MPTEARWNYLQGRAKDPKIGQLIDEAMAAIERDYAVIVAVADKIPNNVLEEDPKLLMWYDQAVTRMGGE